MLKAKKGRLLISEPTLFDETFFKSVILLTHYSKEESIGLILNKPTKINLNEILEEINSDQFTIYVGGPVGKNSIQFIHTLGEKISKSIEILEGLYWGGDFDQVTQLINAGEVTREEMKFFIGYTGWGEEQLDKEIREESWIVTKGSNEECIKHTTSQIWSELIKTQKNKYAIWTNLPKDPSLN